MVKTLTIDGRPVTFRATAAVPRLYRIKFRRDIMQDMDAIQKALKKAEESDDSGSNIPPSMLDMFENIAYIMARTGDPENTPASLMSAGAVQYLLHLRNLPADPGSVGAEYGDPGGA